MKSYYISYINRLCGVALRKETLNSNNALWSRISSISTKLTTKSH